MDKKFKSAGNNYDYIIAGGSNALVGLSAQELSRKTGYSAYNLAISSCEGAGLLNYQVARTIKFWRKNVSIFKHELLVSRKNLLAYNRLNLLHIGH